MSKSQVLRLLVEQRLTAAAEEIFMLFERTIAEYEEELCRSKEENDRQRELLDAVFKPQVRLHRADDDELLRTEDVPEQQQWSSGVDQEDPEPPHIKEEQEELWSSQEGEQLQGLEEADVTRFSFTTVIVKSEDDEEKPESSQLHQSPSEENTETQAPTSSANTSDSSGLQTEIRHDDWKENKETHSAEKPFSCLVCTKYFSSRGSLRNHLRTHTVEKPFICSVCNRGFRQRSHLIDHMNCHTGEKPFICPVCGNGFRQRTNLTRHMRCHSGEKPFSCSVCGKKFSHSHSLKIHMTRHSGERPFSCSICAQSFSQRSNLTRHMVCHFGENSYRCSESFTDERSLIYHMSVDEEEKLISCSICEQRFTEQRQLQEHRCDGETSQLHQSPPEENTETPPPTGADGDGGGGPEEDPPSPTDHMLDDDIL